MQVSLSSLNRHAVATRADVGLPKAKVLKVHTPTWEKIPVGEISTTFSSVDIQIVLAKVRSVCSSAAMARILRGWEGGSLGCI